MIKKVYNLTFYANPTLWVGLDKRGSLIKNRVGSKNILKTKIEGSNNSSIFIGLPYKPETSKDKSLLIKQSTLKNQESYWNQCFDKGRLKNFILWFFLNNGEHKTIKLVEQFKTLGFEYATKAGISLGIEDLKIPPKKAFLIYEAETITSTTVRQYKRGDITGVERFQRLIDTWHRTSEQLKQEVIDNFEATDILNPVYMMAFSGARGNISQVRQLVGMRGLMANPQGQIIDFPIRSNFREGLTLTEYIISSYGSRKGIVDTALRTANAGYLTRRLVDVAQHVIISNFDCGTRRGIFLSDMKEGNKTILSLQTRLVGRVCAQDIYVNGEKIAKRNNEISIDLAFKISQVTKKVFVRSALTCETKKLVCQLCYGWSLAQGNLVSIGEAIGVIAAQSIGEPGTQLTMRTFHTGGVFSGDITDQVRMPFNGFVNYTSPIPGTLIRTPEGKIAFLTKSEGSFVAVSSNGTQKKKFKIPEYTLLFVRQGEFIVEKEVVAQISSISKQKNATDDAELTIKSEIQGQIYIQNLIVKETKVGPKLSKKNIEKEEEFNQLILSLNTANNKGGGSREDKEHSLGVTTNYISPMDSVFTAWNWGNAWILSGQIYHSPQPSSFFAKVGDYINSKSSLVFSKGKSSFSNISGLIKLTKNSIPLYPPSIPPIKGDKKGPSIKGDGNIPSYDFEFLSLSLSSILYKKIGYFGKLTSSSIPYSSYSITSKKVLNSNDAIFIIPPIPLKDKNNLSNLYPSNWQSNFNIILQWFPELYKTLPVSNLIVENISTIHPLYPWDIMKNNPPRNNIKTKQKNTNKSKIKQKLICLNKSIGILASYHLRESIPLRTIKEKKYIKYCLEGKNNKRSSIIRPVDGDNYTLGFSRILSIPSNKAFKDQSLIKTGLNKNSNIGKIINLSSFISHLKEDKKNLSKYSSIPLKREKKPKGQFLLLDHLYNKNSHSFINIKDALNVIDKKINPLQQTVGFKKFIYSSQRQLINTLQLSSLYKDHPLGDTQKEIKNNSKPRVFPKGDKKQLDFVTNLSFSKTKNNLPFKKKVDNSPLGHKEDNSLKKDKTNSLPNAWVYLVPFIEYLPFLKNESSIIYPGQIIPKGDFTFDRDIVSVNTILINSLNNEINPPGGRGSGNNNNYNFNNWVVNTNSRYKVNISLASPKDKKDKIVALKIQRVHEHFINSLNTKELLNMKADLYQLSKLNENLNINLTQIFTSPKQTSPRLINKSLSSFQLYLENKNSTINKQYSCLQIISKYPSLDINLIPLFNSNYNTDNNNSINKKNSIPLWASPKEILGFPKGSLIKAKKTLKKDIPLGRIKTTNVLIPLGDTKKASFLFSFYLTLPSPRGDKTEAKFKKLNNLTGRVSMLNSQKSVPTNPKGDLTSIAEVSSAKKHLTYPLKEYKFQLTQTTTPLFNHVIETISKPDGNYFFSKFSSNGLRKKSNEWSKITNLNPTSFFQSPYFSSSLTHTLEPSLLSHQKDYPLGISSHKPKNKNYTPSNIKFYGHQFESGQYFSSVAPFAKTYVFSPFEGEIIQITSPFFDPPKEGSSVTKNKFTELITMEPTFLKIKQHTSIILTKADLISFYLPILTQQHNHPERMLYKSSLEGTKSLNTSIYTVKNQFLVSPFREVLIKKTASPGDKKREDSKQHIYKLPEIIIGFPKASRTSSKNNYYGTVRMNKLNKKLKKTKNTSLITNYTSHWQNKNNPLSFLLGDFILSGDSLCLNYDLLTKNQKIKTAVSDSGQVIHLNKEKVTVRKGQSIFVSPKSILHKFDGDFIDPKSPVITLSYQRLKTGDIVQGIPKIEQFFEARTTKRGRLFQDSLPNLLKALYKRYIKKNNNYKAVRQSFYKIQQIIVDGVLRVYRSQGVTIADKHLEIIVKQMTSKVCIIEGGQTGFFPGEIVDLEFIEQVNATVLNGVEYEPLVLGITKSSLEVDSFLSAASFQQTTRVLSSAAISRKKDFLKGLKENVILGNLIPAGTGYLVYLNHPP